MTRCSSLLSASSRRLVHPAFSVQLLALLVLVILAPVSWAQSTAPAFTAEQSLQGENLYRATCQICHGNKLSNGQFGTPLKGVFFQRMWNGRSLGEMLQFMNEKMPPEKPGQFTEAELAALAAFILSENKFTAGEVTLSGNAMQQMDLILSW